MSAANDPKVLDGKAVAKAINASDRLGRELEV